MMPIYPSRIVVPTTILFAGIAIGSVPYRENKTDDKDEFFTA
jgi:hypothetical protein